MPNPIQISDALLRAAVRAARVGLWEWDLSTGKVKFSPEWNSLLGYTETEEPDEFGEWEHRVHPDDLPRMKQLLADYLAAPWPDFQAEFRMRHRDGSWRWILTRAEVAPDALGRPARMIGSHIDITDRRRAESEREAATEALRIAHRQLQESQRLAHIGHWERDLDTDQVTWSDETYRLFGLTPGDPVIGAPDYRELVHPEDRASVARAVHEAVAGVRPYDVEYRVVRPDGQERVLHSRGEIERDASGRPRRMFGVLQDITDRKKAARRQAEADRPLAPAVSGARIRQAGHLTEKDEQDTVVSVPDIAVDTSQRKTAERQLYLLNYALDHVVEAIYLMPGVSPQFAYANQSATDMLGYRRDELTGGMGVFDIDPEWNAERWGAFVQEIRQRRQMTIETVHRTRAGRLIPVEVTGNSFAFDGRDYIMGVVRDISERKATETALRESETMYRSLVNAMAEGVVFQDADGRITAVNPAAEAIQARPAEAMLGKTSDSPQWGAIREDGTPFPGDEHPAMVTLRTGKPQSDVIMGIRRPDGTRGWISINSQPLVRPGEAHPYAVVTTFHDITAHRMAEEAVRTREREYRSLAENTPDFIVRWDRELKRVYVNPAFAAALGSPAEDLVGLPFGSRYTPAAAAAIGGMLGLLGEQIREVFATGEAREIQLPWHTVAGGRVFLTRLIPERAADGTITTVLGIGRDITALKDTERQLRTLTEHSPDIILRFDWEGRYLYASAALEGLTGVPAQEHIGRRLGEVTGTKMFGGGPEAYEVLRHRIGEVAATGKGIEAEISLPLADGPHVFNVRLIPESDESGVVATVLAVARDITEQKRAEEALRTSEQRFRQVTETIGEVFWLTDLAKDEMIYVSPAYERVFGRPCDGLYAAPRSWLDAVHPDDRARVEESLPLQAMGSYDIEYRIVSKTGGVRWIHDRAFPIRDQQGRTYRIAGVAEDVTVRRQLEDQLRQSQKMDAVGQLAGGIAHDFNNMLAVIQMQSSLLLETGTDHPETREGIREILAATERATNLTRQLLTFSRRQVRQPTQLDISETIGNTTKLLRRLLGEDIALETRFAPALPLIHADPGMIEQVLMNLAINARDAMPSGGRLSVTLDPVDIDQQRVALHPGAAPGRYVCLTVADTGSGIPAEALPRIFEPFFTTKEVGRGTGLGLATVFGIVEQHHGWIEVKSEEGRGTTFRVFLPAVESSGSRERPPAPAREARGGNETVLLVEDEAAVRMITRAALERFGYRVLEANAAAAALAVWETADHPIDLLLTDLIMPGGVSGRELAEELRTRDPQLRVVYATGYSPDVVNRLLPLDPGRILLQKPYGLTELAETVRRCLDQPARRRPA